jgi:hypothetical protein
MRKEEGSTYSLGNHKQWGPLAKMARKNLTLNVQLPASPTLVVVNKFFFYETNRKKQNDL